MPLRLFHFGLTPTLSALVCLAPTACLSASAPPAVSARPASADLVKRTLQRLYTAQDAAIARKDAAAFYSVCAPSFVETDQQGHTSTLALDKMVFFNICQNSRSIDTKGVVQSVALQPGGRASATVKVHVHTVLINPTGTLDIDQKVRDNWVKTPAGWRMTASRVLSTRTTATGLALSGVSAPKQ